MFSDSSSRFISLVTVAVCVACGGSGTGGGPGAADSGFGGSGASTGGGGTGGTNIGGAGTGGIGTGGSGAVPTGPCMPTDPSCYAAGPTGPGAACLAQIDNGTSGVWRLRFSSLAFQSPAALANSFVQNAIIDDRMTLDRPSCNQNGSATFTWLLELDSTAGTLKTGGGEPTPGAAKEGCFAQLPGASPPVAPATTSAVLSGGDPHFTATLDALNLPIFFSASDLSALMILPLRKLTIDATFADASHGCIGKYNGDTLLPANACEPDESQRAWTAGGSVKAFITVADADLSFVDTLGSTLCVLLTGDSSKWKGPDGTCKTSIGWQESGGPPQGDWCSTTNSAGGCADAYRVDAEFAASAFGITGDCPPQ